MAFKELDSIRLRNGGIEWEREREMEREGWPSEAPCHYRLESQKSMLLAIVGRKEGALFVSPLAVSQAKIEDTALEFGGLVREGGRLLSGPAPLWLMGLAAWHGRWWEETESWNVAHAFLWPMR